MKRRIYIPTSKGTLHTLNTDTYETVWESHFLKPIFSDPLIHLETGDVFIGCTDSFLYRLSFQEGSILWKVCTNGPIFSCPIFYKDSILIGSHSHQLYQIELPLGKVIQVWESDSPLFSSPCVYKDTFCFVSIKGQCIIQSMDSVTQMIRIPGEVFSTPLMLNHDTMVIGSRNDWIYCINLNSFFNH